jgi:hypothetical protein
MLAHMDSIIAMPLGRFDAKWSCPGSEHGRAVLECKT